MNESEWPNYYEILGVAPNADAKTIREAYRRVAQQYHPDKVRHLGAEFSELAERRMRRINHAYEVLNDPLKRRRYDDECGFTRTASSSTQDSASSSAGKEPPREEPPHNQASGDSSSSTHDSSTAGSEPPHEEPPHNDTKRTAAPPPSWRAVFARSRERLLYFGLGCAFVTVGWVLSVVSHNAMTVTDEATTANMPTTSSQSTPTTAFDTLTVRQLNVVNENGVTVAEIGLAASGGWFMINGNDGKARATIGAAGQGGDLRIYGNDAEPRALMTVLFSGGWLCVARNDGTVSGHIP
jgi:curved DNA-binding protein CbpA